MGILISPLSAGLSISWRFAKECLSIPGAQRAVSSSVHCSLRTRKSTYMSKAVSWHSCRPRIQVQVFLCDTELLSREVKQRVGRASLQGMQTDSLRCALIAYSVGLLRGDEQQLYSLIPHHFPLLTYWMAPCTQYVSTNQDLGIYPRCTKKKRQSVDFWKLLLQTANSDLESMAR